MNTWHCHDTWTLTLTCHDKNQMTLNILDREDRWFERGVKEAIFVKVERPSLNRGGGLRHHLSSAYNMVLKTIPRRFTDTPSCSTSWAGGGASSEAAGIPSSLANTNGLQVSSHVTSCHEIMWLPCVLRPELLPVHTKQLMKVFGWTPKCLVFDIFNPVFLN